MLISNTVINNYYYAEIDFGDNNKDVREIWNINKKSNKKEKSDFQSGTVMGALYEYNENAFSINEAYCWIYEKGATPKLYWEK